MGTHLSDAVERCDRDQFNGTAAELAEFWRVNTRGARDSEEVVEAATDNRVVEAAARRTLPAGRRARCLTDSRILFFFLQEFADRKEIAGLRIAARPRHPQQAVASGISRENRDCSNARSAGVSDRGRRPCKTGARQPARAPSPPTAVC